MKAFIPSPAYGVLHIGPFPLRAYAACILLGIIVACWIGDRRWVQRGGEKGTVWDVAATAVPFGLIGARLYHVITSSAPYQKDPIAALYIWRGGLGIWGGVAGGALGAWLVLRHRGLSFLDFADALAPALPVAQAIGRFGNYFNQELYGRHTSLPWGLEIDAAHSPNGVAGTYHPTFLYESLWDLGVAGLVIWADRRFHLDKGRAFALYVAAYCAGRAWIEALRVDQAHRFFGLRLNDYVSLTLFVGAVVYMWVRRPKHAEESSDVPSEV